ncbi:MAG: AAA domain-containing protein [Saprospiraceae bacterium]
MEINLSARQKCNALFESLTMLYELITKDEFLHFTTLFSRIAYVGTKFSMSSQDLHFIHTFRKAIESNAITNGNASLFEKLGLYTVDILLRKFWNISIEISDEDITLLREQFKKTKHEVIHFRSVIEALVFEIDSERRIILFYDENNPDETQKALFDESDRNELFTRALLHLRSNGHLPIHVNLIDVEIDANNLHHPAAFVIHPDHLVDVTAIAETFKEQGNEPFIYLLSKFKPATPSKSVLIGNVVNGILDLLISQPNLEFKSIISKIFAFNPLGFSLLEDDEVKDTIRTLMVHFTNLSQVIRADFKRLNINVKDVYLEPSFYSRRFGIQGRLDILHQNKTSTNIIELKSGKTFKPNVYGINASHFIQTLLYDLLLKSIGKSSKNSAIYILYSLESEKTLRFAPAVRQQQYEALTLRNDILMIEFLLRNAHNNNGILKYLKPENFPNFKGFLKKDIELFYNIYVSLKQVERSYYDHIVAFIAREHSLSKTGSHGINSSNGHASLWLESDSEKIDRFVIFKGLSIESNSSSEDDPCITFKRDPNITPLANFRVGDIGVLYPDDGVKSILKHQIFKCIITAINRETVSVRLRHRQLNQNIFLNHDIWNIETDALDSNYNGMYKSLFLWASASEDFRQLFLGIRPPNQPRNLVKYVEPSEMTSSQKIVLNAALSAKDYYFIWGPPGTGKTSVLLKNLVFALHTSYKQSIMLLAYTNRAVDEICHALTSLGDGIGQHFIRIGSRVGTEPQYRPRLLDTLTAECSTRQEIVDLLSRCNIYVATVSSMMSKPELFALKQFDTVIVDEASQILEPMLSGILTYFSKWILIGDHKQLPAVVVQEDYLTKVKDKSLCDLGISDLRLSLFDRLLRRIKEQQWTHAYGVLTEQGRMHPTLMQFVNHHFYEGVLMPLKNVDRFLETRFFKNQSLDTALSKERLVFLPANDPEDINWKTNKIEAHLVISMLQSLIELYDIDNKEFTEESIGIITPYRAQIALIKHLISENLPEELSEKITVDTVERYQGGARDIIIISFCINRITQLETFISKNDEGIDRKLNVALTRAREQIIAIGNEKLLGRENFFNTLFSEYYIMKG